MCCCRERQPSVDEVKLLILASTDPELRQLRLHRVIVLCAAVTYFSWWFFVQLALPGAFNPFVSRAVVVACFLGVLAASYASTAVAIRLENWLAFCCGIATAHYFYLFDRNHADLDWVIGSYITVIAICAILQTAKSLLYYSFLVVILSVVILLREPGLSFAVFFPGMMTILLFANVGLRSRLRLLDQLKDSRRVAIQDLTARKRAESALMLANRDLESFSYSVAHDLRAPLRAVDGFSQMLLEDYAERLDQEGHDYLRKIRAAAQRMTELIDDLLMLSRISRTDLVRQRLDLSHLAKSVFNQLRSSNPERSVSCTVQESMFVDGDRQLLLILLENLIGNAWKFTTRTPEAKIEMTAETSSEGTVYSLRDNGAGFDMTFADKLFAPFQRLHQSVEYPGTGIGLATVQRIVRSHGGRVWAEAAVDQGATFHFTLQAGPSP